MEEADHESRMEKKASTRATLFLNTQFFVVPRIKLFTPVSKQILLACLINTGPLIHCVVPIKM